MTPGRPSRRRFLRRSFAALGGVVALGRFGRGAEAEQPDAFVVGQKPAIGERGVYLNIPAPLHPLTVHDWDDARWSGYLDTLAAGRINRLYFYLWQGSHSDFACAPEHRDRNRRLHERMRWVIGEARQRGMKVVFLFCPTYIPRVLWQQHRALHADIEYVRAGFPCICPSQPKSWPLMRKVCDHELEWFKDADGFQLCFYDPGGCMCAQCRRDLAAPLLRQVDEFSRIAWQKNPQAEFQVSLWPIWAWESHLNRPYGVELLDRMKAHFGAKHGQIAIADSADHPRSFLGAAKTLGFQTQAFVFSTDVESPFVFLNPQFAYLRRTAARIAAEGHTGAFVHSLLPGSKALGTFVAALALWNPEVPADELARAAALRFTDDPSAARKLVPALLAWESLLLNGNPKPDDAIALRRNVEQALASLSDARRQELEWLPATTRAIEVLVEGTAVPDDALRQKQLAARFRTTLAASPTFKSFAPQAEVVFPHLVRMVDRGWKAAHF